MLVLVIEDKIVIILQKKIFRYPGCLKRTF
jgi:hypothetical protein